jgi:flagellar L-ring protein precursor FlgH
MSRDRVHVAPLLIVVLLACSAGAGRGHAQEAGEKAPKDTYEAALLRHLEEARRQAAARPSDEPSIEWISGLASDRRAFRPNDLLTVRVIENIEAVGTADSSLTKASKASAGVPSLFGLEDKLPGVIDPANLASASSDTSFKGGGATSRSSQLTAVMTTRVAEVLQNGDLLLEGVREITVNGEQQVVVLTGVVRPQDVRRNNIVLSSSVAQLRIQYFGKGLMRDNLKPGWLVRVLNKIF